MCPTAGSPCFSGRGNCSALLTCICLPTYQPHASLTLSNDCSVSSAGHVFLFSAALILTLCGIFTTVLGLGVLRRRGSRVEFREKKRLWATLIALGCVLAVIAMELSWNGEFGVGLGLPATLLFVIGDALFWVLLITRPLNRFEAQYAAMALEQTPRMKRWYGKFIAPSLCVCMTGTDLLVIGIFVAGEELKYELLVALLACKAALMYFTMGILFVTANVLRNLTLKIGNSSGARGTSGRRSGSRAGNPSPPPSSINTANIMQAQQQRVCAFLQAAKLYAFAGFMMCAFSGTTFVAFAAVPLLLKSYVWVLVGWGFLYLALVCTRFSYKSIKRSRAVYEEEQMASAGASDISSDKSDNPQDQGTYAINSDTIIKSGDSRSASHATPSTGSGKRAVARFPRRLKARRRKQHGVKTKPLEKLDVVNEVTNEGTVNYTHIDGVDRHSLRLSVGATDRNSLRKSAGAMAAQVAGMFDRNSLRKSTGTPSSTIAVEPSSSRMMLSAMESAMLSDRVVL